MGEQFTPERIKDLLSKLTEAISTQKVVEYLGDRLTVQPTLQEYPIGRLWKMPKPMVLRADAIRISQVDLVAFMGIQLLSNRAEFVEAMIKHRQADIWLASEPEVREAPTAEPDDPEDTRAQLQPGQLLIEWAVTEYIGPTV